MMLYAIALFYDIDLIFPLSNITFNLTDVHGLSYKLVI